MSNIQKEDKSDINLIICLQANFFTYLEAKKFDIKDINLFLDFFIINADENHLKKKKKYYIN